MRKLLFPKPLRGWFSYRGQFFSLQKNLSLLTFQFLGDPYKSRKVETDRIGYRDQKTVFSILIDDNLRKKVCDLDIKDKYNRSLILDGKKYDIPEIDDVLKLKKQLLHLWNN